MKKVLIVKGHIGYDGWGDAQFTPDASEAIELADRDFEFLQSHLYLLREGRQDETVYKMFEIVPPEEILPLKKRIQKEIDRLKEANRKDEERRAAAAAKRKEKDAERKRKQLERLKKELGESA